MVFDDFDLNVEKKGKRFPPRPKYINSPHSARGEGDRPAGDAGESGAKGGSGRAEEEAVHLAVGREQKKRGKVK